MSIKFLPAILGPEMAAPILWAPGIFWFFLLENPRAHKIPPVMGGGVLGFFRRGGGRADFIFMGVGRKLVKGKEVSSRRSSTCSAFFWGGFGASRRPASSQTLTPTTGADLLTLALPMQVEYM